jgi:hypothetical protein
MDYILGAINKITNKYENIVFVDKPKKYKCIDCETDLILRKGEKRFQSFIHKNKNGCQYFKYPTQAQLTRDASLHLQVLFEENKLDIYRKCGYCKRKYKMNIPTYAETNSMKLNEISQDVVYFDESNNMICGFTICGPDTPNIETTILDNNYHINMLGLIHTCVQNIATKRIELECSKKIICQECTVYTRMVGGTV